MLAPLLAHGITGRTDLPVPTSLFYWAAAFVLVVSFVLLAGLWNTPWLGSLRQRPAPGWLSRLVLAPPVVWTARAVVLAVFLLTVATATVGNTSGNQNLAPTMVFVVWWVGIAFVSVLAGNLWRALNPWATLARLARVPARRKPWPADVGLFPAAAIFLVWAWLELVYPTSSHMRLLAGVLIGYSLLTLLGMLRYGVDEWLDHGEAFSVYTTLLASMSPWSVVEEDGQRRLTMRVPFVHALDVRPQAGLVLFVTMLIGTVSFDGFSRTLYWKTHSVNAAATLVDRGMSLASARDLIGTFGLVVFVLLALGAFQLAAHAARLVGPLGVPARDAARAFAPSLLPIALAYVVAHYFSFLFFQGQDIYRLASDPFGGGHDLLGTAGFDLKTHYNELSANVVWYVEVAAIVIGHVLGLVLAHDRALELADGKLAAVRSQVCMLALMVLYTVGGLFFLSAALSG